MKIRIFLQLTLIGLLTVSCKHDKLAIAGSGWQELAIVDKATGMIEWKHSLGEGEECNSIEVTSKGDVLYAYKGGARLLNRQTHEVVWDYKVGDNEELHHASCLETGGYLVGVCGNPARIVELDANGAPSKELTFPPFYDDVHYQFRKVTKSDSGVFFIPMCQKRVVTRLTEQGKLKSGETVPFSPYDIALHKSSGNFVVSCWKQGSLLIVNPYLQEVNNYVEIKELKGGLLLNPAEVRFCGKDNLMIANSNLFSDNKTQPLLLEINDHYEVVWSLPLNTEIKNITTFFPFKE